MHTACISLQPQRNNKSKELCISSACRAECKNMAFCTTALCPVKFPGHCTNLPAPASHQHLLFIPAGLLYNRSASEGVVAPSFHSTAVFDYLMGRKRKQSQDLPRGVQWQKQWTQTATREIPTKYEEKFFHHKVGQRLDQVTQVCGSSTLGHI